MVWDWFLQHVAPNVGLPIISTNNPVKKRQSVESGEQLMKDTQVLSLQSLQESRVLGEFQGNLGKIWVRLKVSVLIT